MANISRRHGNPVDATAATTTTRPTLIPDDLLPSLIWTNQVQSKARNLASSLRAGHICTLDTLVPPPARPPLLYGARKLDKFEIYYCSIPEQMQSNITDTLEHFVALK